MSPRNAHLAKKPQILRRLEDMARDKIIAAPPPGLRSRSRTGTAPAATDDFLAEQLHEQASWEAHTYTAARHANRASVLPQCELLPTKWQQRYSRCMTLFIEWADFQKEAFPRLSPPQGQAGRRR